MSRWANRAMFAARGRGGPRTNGALLATLAARSALAFEHYSEPHTEPIAGCPECAAVVETFTLTLSAYWQPPVDVVRLFAKGAPVGFMRPLHND